MRPVLSRRTSGRTLLFLLRLTLRSPIMARKKELSMKVVRLSMIILFGCALSAYDVPGMGRRFMPSSASLVIINTTEYRLSVTTQEGAYGVNEIQHGNVEPGTAKILEESLRAGLRYKVHIILHASGGRNILTDREVWINNPGPGEPVPSAQIVVAWQNKLVTWELAGEARLRIDLRRSDLLVENNTGSALRVFRSWKFDPFLPATNTDRVGGALPMTEQRLPGALFIGQNVITITALRPNGDHIKSIERSIYVNNPGEGLKPADQRLVVTDRDFGPFRMLEGSPNRGRQAPLWMEFGSIRTRWSSALRAAMDSGTRWKGSPSSDSRMATRDSGTCTRFAPASSRAKSCGGGPTGRSSGGEHISSPCGILITWWTATYCGSG